MDQLKVVSYNIQHGRNLQGQFNLQETGSVLAGLTPDIVALQEVDHCRWKTWLGDQAGILGKRLGMYWAYGPVSHYLLGSYGNAILSRYPIKASNNHVFTNEDDRRCCLEVEILAEDVRLCVLCVHLGLKMKDRLEQLQNMIIPLIENNEVPCILAGDFNTSADSPEINLVLAHMQDSFTANSGAETATFPSNHPHIRIDYIFTSNCRAGDFRIVPDAAASDHLPVRAEIAFDSFNPERQVPAPQAGVPKLTYSWK